MNEQLYHAKWILSTTGLVNDDTVLYLGSHNLSQAAWGIEEKNGSQLTIFNTELGVVFPAAEGSSKLKETLVGLLPLKSVKAAKYNLEIDRPFIMAK